MVATSSRTVRVWPGEVTVVTYHAGAICMVVPDALLQPKYLDDVRVQLDEVWGTEGAAHGFGYRLPSDSEFGVCWGHDGFDVLVRRVRHDAEMRDERAIETAYRRRFEAVAAVYRRFADRLGMQHPIRSRIADVEWHFSWYGRLDNPHAVIEQIEEVVGGLIAQPPHRVLADLLASSRTDSARYELTQISIRSGGYVRVPTHHDFVEHYRTLVGTASCWSELPSRARVYVQRSHFLTDEEVAVLELAPLIIDIAGQRYVLSYSLESGVRTASFQMRLADYLRFCDDDGMLDMPVIFRLFSITVVAQLTMEGAVVVTAPIGSDLRRKARGFKSGRSRGARGLSRGTRAS